MTKLINMNIRLSSEDNYSIREGHEASGSEAGFSGYVRDVLTGEIPHPNFDPERLRAQEFSQRNDIGYVEGVEETRNHYLAVSIAAILIRVKMDPEYRQYMDGDPKTFRKLVDDIRGYKFDDKTQKKSPLKTNQGT